MASLTHVVVDTSTLEAVCKTDYSEPVFARLTLCTTDICFEELKRNRSSSSDFTRKRAIRTVFDHRRAFGTPVIVPTGLSYDAYVEDQGEASIIHVLRSNPDSDVRYVLLFDFSAAEEIESVVDPTVVEVNTPARAFELVWQGGYITETEHHRALRQLADREGWKGEALVDALSHTDYDDVF